MLKVQSGSATYVGQRSVNEDHVLVRTDLDLYLVADGAGGRGAGDVASKLATSSIADWFSASAPAADAKGEVDAFGLFVVARRLSSAIQRANREVCVAARAAAEKQKGQGQGMGTTVVAAVPAAKSAAIHVAHVGDSRCYRLRGGYLEQLTEDHSLLHDVLESWPDLDDAALAKLPRNVVTRALGMGDTLRVSVRSHEMLGGDRYLLCTDGLTSAVAPDEIAELLSDTTKRPPEIARSLVAAAKRAHAADNVAVVVIVCEGAGAPFKAPRTPTILPPQHQEDSASAGVIEHDDPEIVILGVAEGPTSTPEPVVVPRSASDPPGSGGKPAWREALDELIAPPKPTTNKPER